MQSDVSRSLTCSAEIDTACYIIPRTTFQQHVLPIIGARRETTWKKAAAALAAVAFAATLFVGLRGRI